MLCSSEKGRKFQFHILRFDLTGFEPTTYHTGGKHHTADVVNIPLIKMIKLNEHNN